MKINNKAKSYLIITGYLLAGFIIMGIVQVLGLPSWLNSCTVLLLFILVNIFTAKKLQLDNEIKTFWSLKKLPYLPIGIIAGGLISISPVLAGLIAGKITSGELIVDHTFTASSIALTLIIVSWEELWFRGIFLNHCKKYLSEINISITIGLLFMLVHLLNPEINLLKTGPTLFFAGLFLTLVYFYFKTLWLPVGLHFGNNYLSLETKMGNDLFFGNEGYVGALVLAGLSFLFIQLTLVKIKRQKNAWHLSAPER